MDFVSLAVGVIGVVPTLIIFLKYLSTKLPVKKFVGLNSPDPIDVLITTSSVTKSSKGAKVVRSTTGIGQVQGVAYLSKFIGLFYKNKSTKIHMGNDINVRPKKDLVLLGGPAKNDYSKRFIEYFCAKNQSLALRLNDELSQLEIQGECYDFDQSNLERGKPTSDIGLVICWNNPFSPKPSDFRAIYCAGFTSFGTSGCAMWLFNDVLGRKQGFRELTEQVGKKIPNFVAILDMKIINGGVVGIELKKAIAVPT